MGMCAYLFFGVKVSKNFLKTTNICESGNFIEKSVNTTSYIGVISHVFDQGDILNIAELHTTAEAEFLAALNLEYAETWGDIDFQEKSLRHLEKLERVAIMFNDY